MLSRHLFGEPTSPEGVRSGEQVLLRGVGGLLELLIGRPNPGSSAQAEHGVPLELLCRQHVPGSTL
jgi:hypothetical protein